MTDEPRKPFMIACQAFLYDVSEAVSYSEADSSFFHTDNQIVTMLYYNPVLNSFESVKMSQALYLKALGLFFARP